MQKFQEEDQALFEAIEEYRNGNQDKATFIYESTKKYAYKVVHQEVERYKSQSILTGDEISVTEDIMQDLYIEFFNKIEKFRNEDPRSIFKWISVVSHRMLLDYVDKNKMEVLQFEKDEDYREDNDIWDSSEINDSDMESHHELLPEAALEEKEFQQLILDFIQSLPEAQAQTILLHFRGGLKYQEIADEMGVSLITVKTRMKKAKDSLEEIITKYEKNTGTKLHSVSILPLLWLLYRMASEDTTVPVAVDAAVTGSVAGASGAGIAGATTATKVISTRVLIAIVSTAVAIGGVDVGSQLVDKKQETSVEQEDLEENGADDNQNDDESDASSKTDTDTSNTNGEPTDSTTNQSNQNETADGNDTNNSDNNVTQDSNGAGNSTNETDSNTSYGNGNTSSNDGSAGSGDTSGNDGSVGRGDTSGNEGTVGSGDSANGEDSGNDSGNEDSGNDTANEDTSETTTAKGTKENPYRIGEKISITGAAGYLSSDTSAYDVELTVTEYVVPKLENATYVTYANTNKILNVVKAKIKITRDSSEAYGQTPLALGLLSEDEKGNVQSGYLHKQNGDIITSISNNTEYDVGFHMTTSAFNEELTYSYFRISYKNLNNSYSYIYVKLE